LFLGEFGVLLSGRSGVVGVVVVGLLCERVDWLGEELELERREGLFL
jgi:hypothetical protein